MGDDQIKQYKLTDKWKDWSVVLEVDHSILTPEVATEHNQFWTNDKDRLEAAGGDVVKAVIKMAAADLVYAILRDGLFGGDISVSGRAADLYTKEFQDEEGWGGSVEGNLFGRVGIRLVRADIDASAEMEFA